MSNTDFLGRAIEMVKQAIESDTVQDYEKAYQQYYSALELFMLALKWEKNPKSKEMIRTKAGEYMERAEKLKQHLADSDRSNRKKPAAVRSNGRVAGGGGKGRYVELVRIINTTLQQRAETTTRMARTQTRKNYGPHWPGPSSQISLM